MCALFAAVPLIYLVVRTADIGPVAFIETLLRERVLRLASHSVLLAVAVTTSCIALGTAVAWVVSRIQIPGGRLWLLTTALPLAVPSYLAAYGWLVAIPGLNGFFPSWFVMTAVCTPYVALPVSAALRRASTDDEAVARTLGYSALQCFWSVTWPRIRPAATAGALLACLYTLSDFGAVSMLRFQTLTWGINAAYSASFDRSQAAVLALLLVVLALIVVTGERRVRRATVPMPARHVSPVTQSRRWMPVLLTVVAIGPAIGVVIPIAGLANRLLQADTIRAIDPQRLLGAIGASLALAVIAAVVAVALALPIAALAARFRGRLVLIIESVGYLGHALPGIVVGLSLVFASLALVPMFYQTVVVLVLAYAVLFMSKAIGSARNGIEAVPQSLTGVSRTLGFSAAQTWWRVTARIAAPSIGVGALLVAIAVMKELPATLLLRPTGISTLSVELWRRTAVFEFGAAAPYAAALVLVAAVPALLLSGARGIAKEEKL